MNTNQVTIIDPQTGKRLGLIALSGAPIPANPLLSTNGRLQCFTLLAETDQLWQVWLNQQAVLLRTEQTEQLAKIVTYPSEDENQAYLEIISTKEKYHENTAPSPAPKPIHRRFAFIQTLLGT